METTRIGRRHLLIGAGGAALAIWSRGAQAAPTLGDDGLYEEPWFLQSFLDLKEDLQGAHAAGKRYAIMWEQRGCPYCKKTHEVNLADPKIASYIRDNFVVLQLNLVGSRRVTDFDGKEVAEKELAAKYGVRFTPTIQFFPETADGLAAKEPMKRESTRAFGYLEPPAFLAMFKYVREKAYERGSFRDYLARAS